MTYAVIFPGQGAALPGAGQPWVDHPAWQVVREAEAATGPSRPPAPRRRRRRARHDRGQPDGGALTSLVAWRAVEDTLPGRPVAFAGHSLGQITALLAAGPWRPPTATGSPPPGGRQPALGRCPARPHGGAHGDRSGRGRRPLRRGRRRLGRQRQRPRSGRGGGDAPGVDALAERAAPRASARSCLWRSGTPSTPPSRRCGRRARPHPGLDTVPGHGRAGRDQHRRHRCRRPRRLARPARPPPGRARPLAARASSPSPTWGPPRSSRSAPAACWPAWPSGRSPT